VSITFTNRYLALTSPRVDPEIASQVSWQSAFWGLVPIALNSMVQPSGKVCDAPAGIGHLLQISPVMCLLDVLIFIVRTIAYTVKTGTFSAANKEIIIERYTVDDVNSGAFKEFRENTYTRWIVFAFSVPQIVKLFAFQGVLVTQICAAIFLGSFVVIELFVVLPRAYTSLEAPEASEYNMENAGFNSLPYLTVAASTCFILYAAIQALVSIFEAHGLALDALQSTGLTILFCGSAAFVPSGLYSHFLRLKAPVSNRVAANSTRQEENEAPAVKQRRQFLALENLLLLLILAVPTAYYVLSYLLSPLRRNQHALDPTTGNIVAPIMIGIWATLCLLWASVTFKAVIASGRATTRRVEIMLSWYFWSLHLVAALLYYKYVYDPKGTVKPAWTEQLG
jgi:hypothetical protein